MGRALSRYMPVDMAILSIVELVLSFTVIHFMLDLPPIGGTLASGSLLADGAGDLGRLAPGHLGLLKHGNDLATLLALTGIGVTVMTEFRQPEICLDRRRLLVAAGLAGVVAFPMFLFISSGFVQGGTTVRLLWLSKILGV